METPEVPCPINKNTMQIVAKHVGMPHVPLGSTGDWLAIGEGSEACATSSCRSLKSAAGTVVWQACALIIQCTQEHWHEQNWWFSIKSQDRHASLYTNSRLHLPPWSGIANSALAGHAFQPDISMCHFNATSMRFPGVNTRSRKVSERAITTYKETTRRRGQHRRRSGGGAPRLVPDANRLQLVHSVPRGVCELPRSAALTFSILIGSPAFVTTFRMGRRHRPLTRLKQAKEDPFTQD